MTVDEIQEHLLEYVPDNYDISNGSFWSDLLKPVAVQIYLLQNKIATLQDNTFAITASGKYLDRKVAEQGLTRKIATYATGTLRIYGIKGEVVLAGAKAAAENVLYAVDETATIPECGYIDVTATCTTAGNIGNVKAGEINRFPVLLRNLTAVENITDFEGGYDEESDFDLLERYLEKVSRPNVSGNKYHYIEWTKEVTGVGDVQVIPLWDGAGTVEVVITDANGMPADDDLVQAVKDHIDDNKPIGADVTVVSAETLTINISVAIVTDGTEVDTATANIETAISDYLGDEASDDRYVSYAKIGSAILSAEGVDDYSDLTVNGGTVNIDIADNAVPVLGSVSVV